MLMSKVLSDKKNASYSEFLFWRNNFHNLRDLPFLCYENRRSEKTRAAKSPGRAARPGADPLLRQRILVKSN